MTSKKFDKLKVGGKKIKSENIEIAILIFNLLHQARGRRKYRRTDRQTDRQTHRHTDRKFFYGSCDKGLRRRKGARTCIGSDLFYKTIACF